MSQTIVKPWGEEIILTNPSLPYAGKIIKIKADQRLSLQYHDQKTETLTLISGQATITLGPDQANLVKTPLVINQEVTIMPLTIHRLEAQQDSTIFEVSTPEIGTTYRLDDDFHRPHETETIRNSFQRGWTNDQ